MEDKPQNQAPPPINIGKGKSPNKFIALIVALLMIVVAMGVLLVYHPVTVGSKGALTVQNSLVQSGSAFSLNITTNGKFQNMTVYWGDGSSTHLDYGGSDQMHLQHVYQYTGTYYVYYTLDFGSSNYSNINNLAKVVVSSTSLNKNSSNGLIELSKTTSSSPIANTTGLFNPGSNLSYLVGYNTKPVNSSYMVFSQKAYLYENDSLIKTFYFPYNYQASSVSYELPIGGSHFNMSDLKSGYYSIKLNTYTGTLLKSSRNTSATISNVTYESLNAGTTAAFPADSVVSGINGVNLSLISNSTMGLSNGAIINLSKDSKIITSNNTWVKFNSNAALNVYGAPSNSLKSGSTYEFLSGEQYNFTTYANFTLLNLTTVNMLKGTSINMESANKVDFNSSTIFEVSSGTAKAAIMKIYAGAVTSNIENGGIDNSEGIFSTTTYLDVPVFKGANLLSTSSSSSFLVHTEAASGTGYLALDPALAQDSGSEELQMNTLQSLVVPMGSSSTQFANLLASKLPTIANGGINNNYVNYTVTPPWGKPYKVSVEPYQNYTFNIRANATWQNGQPVTAWDALYSFARVLLYDAEPATTPGYLFAPSLLPGNYLTSNTFWNITQNITVNNNTNNVTFHFQHPVSPVVVNEIFSGPGSYIVNPNWLIQHGDGLPWNSMGFLKYKSSGAPINWNPFVTHNTFADGPYMIQYQQVGSEAVIVKNPKFVSPGPWFPAPAIKRVEVQYISDQSTIYLELHSKQSQISTIPTNSWSEAELLNSSGIDTWVQYPTLLIYPAFINAHVAASTLSRIVSNANLPPAFFSSIYARKALAYAFNYQYFLNNQLNNPSYKGVTFGIATAGILQKGLSVSENISQLNASTGGQVPYFSLAKAKSYWDMFMKYDASKLGIVNGPNGPTYNGAPLVIPVFVQKSFPAGSTGVTTWSSEISKFIPNAKLLPVAMPIGQIIGYFIQRPNPMPIWIAGWAPENANAYGNIEPLAAPNNGGQIMPADSFLPSWFTNSSNPLQNQQQANNMTEMLKLYNNSQSTSIQSTINSDFIQMNNIYVNMTVNLYLTQIVDQWVVAKNLNLKQMAHFDENPVLNAYNILYYNWVSFS